MQEVLGPEFGLTVDEVVSKAVSKRSWQERWVVFSRSAKLGSTS